MNRRITEILESRWFLPAVALFALAVRLALVFVTYKYKTPVFADEVDYLNIGISLKHGHGFIKEGIMATAYRPPAQPLMIAFLFRLFGENYVSIKVFEALLLLVIPFVCFKIGRLLGLSVAASNVGAAVATLHPALAYASSTIYPTVLTAVALTLGVWLCSIAIAKDDLKVAIGAGLALGATGSATTTFAPLAAMAGFVMLFRRSYRTAVAVGVLGILPIVVWMVRNKHEVGRFTVATNGGYNLYLGANDDVTPRSGNWVDPHLFDEHKIGELALDDGYRKVAVRWIKEHPVRWTGLAIARALLVFDSVGNPRTQGLHSGLLGHLVGWIMLPVVILGVIGLIVSYRNPAAWLTMMALLLVMASSAATISKPRFRFPCDPLLAEFAVVGFLQIKNRVSAGRLNDSIESHVA